jgi:hypothetical protein
LTGRRDAISAPVNDAMFVSGLGHVLSISGYHKPALSCFPAAGSTSWHGACSVVSDPIEHVSIDGTKLLQTARACFPFASQASTCENGKQVISSP